MGGERGMHGLRYKMRSGSVCFKLKANVLLGRPWHRPDDTNKTDLSEIGWGVWNGLTTLRMAASGGLFCMC